MDVRGKWDMSGKRLCPGRGGSILVGILDGRYIELPLLEISEGRKLETSGLWESLIICKEFRQFGEALIESAPL